jgi:hypothetical protein
MLALTTPDAGLREIKATAAAQGRLENLSWQA